MAFGVFVPPIKKYLGTSTSSTAFIGSLHIGLCYLAAPFNLTLAKTFGFRKVAICGSLIVTAALITCGYIDTLSSLTILYGVCAGLATSAIYFCMLFVKFHGFACWANQWPLPRRKLFSFFPSTPFSRSGTLARMAPFRGPQSQSHTLFSELQRYLETVSCMIPPVEVLVQRKEQRIQTLWGAIACSCAKTKTKTKLGTKVFVRFR